VKGKRDGIDREWKEERNKGEEMEEKRKRERGERARESFERNFLELLHVSDGHAA